MKKVLAISILAAMLLSVSMVAMADATNWVMTIKASDTANGNSGSTLSLGWMNGKTDGQDAAELSIASDPPAPKSFAYVLSNLTAGPAGSGGLSKQDFRQPWATRVAGPVVFDLQVSYRDNGAGAINPIRLWFTQSTSSNIFPWSVEGINIKLEAPQGTTGSTAADSGTTWTFVVAKPLATGFYLDVPGSLAAQTVKMTISAGGTVITPEPSSMVALASGLFGLVGFGIRRRK